MNNTTIKGQAFGKSTEVGNLNHIDVKRAWRQGVTAGAVAAYFVWAFFMNWSEFLNSLPTPLALLLLLGVFFLTTLYLKVTLPFLSSFFSKGMRFLFKKFAGFFGIKVRLKKGLRVCVTRAGILKIVLFGLFGTVAFFEGLLHPKANRFETLLDAVPLWLKICVWTLGVLLIGWACVCFFLDKKRLREEKSAKGTD